jgi:rubrerythrin
MAYRHSLMLVVVVAAVAAPPALARIAPPSTVSSLQTAFEAELNAAQRFRSFARAAEEEGLPGIGRLFRALARGEEIHAQSHAEVLRSLGIDPRATLADVEVKGTRENLQAAVALESSDRDGLYPTLLGAAREIGDSTPLGSLGVAMFVERAHVLLLGQALRDVEAGRDWAGDPCVSRRSGYVAACGAGNAVAWGARRTTLERVD